MDQTRTSQVLIAGAGPTGLVLACDLARRGIGVQVIDAATGPAQSSRAKGLSPRSLEVLDDLGAVGRVLASGRSRIPLLRWQGYRPLGSHELNGDVPEGPARPYARTMLVAQSRVEEALRERLASLGVAIEWATRLRSFDQRPDGVHVVAADRNGKTRALRTRWLVGCDGAGSTVRRQAGIGFLGKTDEEDRVLVGDLVLDGLDRDHWHMWPKPSGAMLGLCPLPALDAFQLQAIVTTEFGDSPTLDQVRRFVADWTGRSDIRIQSAPWLSLWRSNVRMVNRYRAGRVFLAGDAAHVHPAAGGLGMNTGMQDAYNLGWKIAATIAGAASDALLDTYEAERLPVAADVLGFSSELHARGATGIFSTQGQPSDTLQLGISYRGGPLSFESPAGAPALLPGDRAPDGLGVTADGEGRRLFDVFRGTHVTALMFGGRKAEVPDSLLGLKVRQVVVHAAAGGPQLEAETLRDEDGSIHEAYAAKPGTTVVIRPDGYVLSRAEPGETAAVPAAFGAFAAGA